MSNITWCVEQHEKTNHRYEKEIPYRFHLDMTWLVYDQFKGLLDNEKHVYPFFDVHEDVHTLKDVCGTAVFGHDLIEDTRVSYNEVKNELGQAEADIIYALTNEKGKNRKERANDKYYEGIRNTPGAVFVKLCDRIANVRFSKMTQSRHFEMYKEENVEFMLQLGWDMDKTHEYEVMFDCLIDLFKTKFV